MGNLRFRPLNFVKCFDSYLRVYDDSNGSSGSHGSHGNSGSKGSDNNDSSRGNSRGNSHGNSDNPWQPLWVSVASV